MFEFRFSRALTSHEAMTLMRALVARGSRLVFSPSAEVTGAIARTEDLKRWIESGVDRGVIATRAPDRETAPANEVTRTIPAESIPS
jgi:hypothetical protein